MLFRITRCFMLVLLCLVNPAMGQDLDSLKARLDTTRAENSQIDLQLQIAYALSDTDIREALECASQALKDAQKIESVRWTAEAKLAIGRFYDYLGVNQEAAAT
jgi:hypothetical protein